LAEGKRQTAERKYTTRIFKIKRLTQGCVKRFFLPFALCPLPFYFLPSAFCRLPFAIFVTK
jgi:hypothetical protein